MAPDVDPSVVLHLRMNAPGPHDHVIDSHGFVWKLVRDGGMASRADDSGILTIGIVALEQQHGPLLHIQTSRSDDGNFVIHLAKED